MTDRFITEESNLLAQSLADLTDEQLSGTGRNLYALTALINSDEKEIIGFIKGVEKLPFFSQHFKDFLASLIPFLTCYGIGKLELSELSALGVKVGHMNKEEISETSEE